MDFAGMKEQLLDRLKEIGERIQESTAYIQLREKFDSLPAQGQKVVIIGAGALMALILLSFPLGYLSTASEYEQVYLENRELIRELLRAANTLKETSPLPSVSSPDAIQSRVQRVIDDLGLTGEQVGNLQPTSRNSAIAGPSVNQAAVSVQLKNLNLRQVTEFMYRLQNLGNGMQPTIMDIRRSQGQTHYFDVIATVVQFSLAGSSEDEVPTSKGRPRPAGRGR